MSDSTTPNCRSQLIGGFLSACSQCRAAKVRCLASRQTHECDRCVKNGFDCIFAQPTGKRGKRNRKAQHSRRRPSLQDDAQQDVPGQTIPPLITADIRRRLVAALATLKGKRGSPFSFVTSDETPSFGTRDAAENLVREAPQQQFSTQSSSTPPSLKLSWLLRPLRAGPRVPESDGSHQPVSPIEMPSYLSSMSLGNNINDPIEGGILSRQMSLVLFDHFMLEMNAKWEYILDPHVDTHDEVRRRSKLLFATVLFCSSKFASWSDGILTSTTDPFLQSRLCMVARSLVIQKLAEGDRSIDTMQALYLLVCWKEPNDDISYLHSGYAFRILHDLDLEQHDGDKWLAARRRRTWLALFRQDKQQSLFFMRRASLGLGDEEGPAFVGDLSTWLKMPHSLPLDFVACCSADVRRLQSRLRVMVKKASSPMLPCLLGLMESELSKWRSTWQDHLEGEGRICPNDDPSLDQRLLSPGPNHLNTLVGLWESSIRLNVASAILRQALMASMASSLRSEEQAPLSSLNFDLPTVVDLLSTDVLGLSISVEGAFGTLRHLLRIPVADLRRSPDAVHLLGPNAALFLCLLLCLPCNGLLGPSFQSTAVGLIQDMARHMAQSVQSPQDTLALNAAYLDSLVNLLSPDNTQTAPDTHSLTIPPIIDREHPYSDAIGVHLDGSELQATPVLAGGNGEFAGVNSHDEILNLPSKPGESLHAQSVANLLDPGFYWEMLPPMPETDALVDLL